MSLRNTKLKGFIMKAVLFLIATLTFLVQTTAFGQPKGRPDTSVSKLDDELNDVVFRPDEVKVGENYKILTSDALAADPFDISNPNQTSKDLVRLPPAIG